MGSDVKRWDYVSGARRKTAVFEQCGDGRWVRYEDYRALKAERDAMEALLIRIIEEHGMDIFSELEDAVSAMVFYDKNGNRLWQNPATQALTEGGNDGK